MYFCNSSPSIVGSDNKHTATPHTPRPVDVHGHPSPNHGAGLIELSTWRSVSNGLQFRDRGLSSTFY